MKLSFRLLKVRSIKFARKILAAFICNLIKTTTPIDRLKEASPLKLTGFNPSVGFLTPATGGENTRIGAIKLSQDTIFSEEFVD